MITESPLMLILLALMSLSLLILLIVAIWVIYTIQEFANEVHRAKTIDVSHLKQTAIQVSQRTIILGLSWATIIFVVSLSQQFDF